MKRASPKAGPYVSMRTERVRVIAALVLDGGGAGADAAQVATLRDKLAALCFDTLYLSYFCLP
jgi:hypothetical protein